MRRVATAGVCDDFLIELKAILCFKDECLGIGIWMSEIEGGFGRTYTTVGFSQGGRCAEVWKKTKEILPPNILKINKVFIRLGPIEKTKDYSLIDTRCRCFWDGLGVEISGMPLAKWKARLRDDL